MTFNVTKSVACRSRAQKKGRERTLLSATRSFGVYTRLRDQHGLFRHFDGECGRWQNNVTVHRKAKSANMERWRAKERSKYVDKLRIGPRIRYLTKLKFINGFDPFESAESERSTHFDLLLAEVGQSLLTTHLPIQTGQSIDELQFRQIWNSRSNPQFVNVFWLSDPWSPPSLSYCFHLLSAR